MALNAMPAILFIASSFFFYYTRKVKLATAVSLLGFGAGVLLYKLFQRLLQWMDPIMPSNYFYYLAKKIKTMRNNPSTETSLNIWTRQELKNRSNKK